MPRTLATALLLTSILLSGSAHAQDLVLFKAIREKQVAEVERLLNTGKVELEPPYKHNFVNKPLAYAAAYGNLEIVKLILAKGADINGRVAYGNVPMIKAIEGNNWDILIHLMKQGADVNLPNDFGISTFSGLCNGTDAEIIKLALAHGGKVNEAYRTNYRIGRERPKHTKTHTALQAAVMSASPEIVQLLLDAGGDPSLEDANGKNCFDLAQAKSRPDVLALLKSRQKK